MVKAKIFLIAWLGKQEKIRKYTFLLEISNKIKNELIQLGRYK